TAHASFPPRAQTEGAEQAPLPAPATESREAAHDDAPARDVSQPREIAQPEDASQHIQRLEVVGRLAGGIAHDFNNTLTVILSYGELLKARLGPGHPLAELADHIVQAAEHGGVLTKQLLTFTRRQVSKPRPVDVRELLRS